MQSILSLQSQRENIILSLASVRCDLLDFIRTNSDKYDAPQLIHIYELSLRELKILDQKITARLLVQYTHFERQIIDVKLDLSRIPNFTVKDLPRLHYSMFE